MESNHSCQVSGVFGCTRASRNVTIPPSNLLPCVLWSTGSPRLFMGLVDYTGLLARCPLGVWKLSATGSPHASDAVSLTAPNSHPPNPQVWSSPWLLPQPSWTHRLPLSSSLGEYFYLPYWSYLPLQDTPRAKDQSHYRLPLLFSRLKTLQQRTTKSCYEIKMEEGGEGAYGENTYKLIFQ